MPYELKNVLDGPDGKALAITPPSSVIGITNTFAFSAAGGVGPYAYTLVSGGGSVDPATGLYTAPGTAGSAVIRVTDKAGKTADATVTITVLTPNLAINPSPASVTVSGTQTFVATGGTPPYTFSIPTTGSGVPSISTAGNLGAYVAGVTPGLDVVQVTDSALPIAHSATANVNVVALLSPDYAVSLDPNIPWSGVVGAAMSATGTTQIKIQNMSANPGHASIVWSVYLSTDNVLDPGDTLVQQGGIGFLPGLGSATVGFSGNWPAAAGVYYLIAAIQASDDSNVANNVVISHFIGIGNFRYLEGAEDNSSVGDKSSPFTPPAGPVSDTGVTVGPNQTLVIEGVMDALNQDDTFKFSVAGISGMAVQSLWISGWDDIDTYMWGPSGAFEASNGGGIDGEPVPLGTFLPVVSGPGTWYLDQNFYLGAGTSGSTGKKYLIFIVGVP